MNESVKNGSSKNLGYMLVLLGIVLVFLSWYFVYKKTNVKIDDINSEISALKSRRNQLKRLEADRAAMLEDKADAEKAYEELIKGYDGGITYRSVIMDAYEMTQEFDIQITRLSLSPFNDVYTFGAIPSSNPNGGTGGANPSYVGMEEQYNITITSDYDTTKEVLAYIVNGGCPYREDGKRKVVRSVIFVPSQEEQTVTMDMTMSDFAITGDDREMTEVPEYEYDKSTPNIFWGDEIIAQ
ncbi:MAG: hypothetical protein II919_07235 [Lachnospiraceae bacterium]|nr:hypothetical protein [Lachnospiraceae bacterium]